MRRNRSHGPAQILLSASPLEAVVQRTQKAKTPYLQGKTQKTICKQLEKGEKCDLLKSHKPLLYNTIDIFLSVTRIALISRNLNVFPANLRLFFSKTTDIKGFYHKIFSELLTSEQPILQKMAFYGLLKLFLFGPRQPIFQKYSFPGVSLLFIKLSKHQIIFSSYIQKIIYKNFHFIHQEL